MVDLHSGRFFKDVGAVEVDAKQHEVLPGVKEVLAKQGGKSGLNSTANVDANTKAVVGADGKGIVNVSVVVPEGPEPDKKPGAKPAKPAPTAKGAVNNQPAGITGAVPTPAPSLAAINPTRRLGRAPGRGVAVRPQNPTVTRQQSQALTATQGPNVLSAKPDAGPKPDKLKSPKQGARGARPLTVKQVAVNVNLQETRRAKILNLMQGGNLTPDKDPKDLPQPHAGRRRDHHKALDRTGFTPNASAGKLGGEAPTPAAKQQPQQRITPATAKMAALPATSPRPGGSTF